MCGIFGTVGISNVSSKSLDTLIHRGPDDFGEYFDKDNDVYLGHRRLSIIDLSKDGRQPMRLNGDSTYITYNGEFYNFQTVKNTYFSEEYFQSKTDTEVILYLYKKFGIRTPEFMRGMFAFCIYDKRKNLIYLCRDRCGIKPLYYYKKNNVFAFSSELCALKNILNIDLEIDLIGLDYYFTYGYIPSPFTAYKYIKKLRPAHFLTYDVGLKNITANEQYWNIHDNINKYKFNSEEEWIENIDFKIGESVSLHLISDVPLGVFLSGGLDSSLIVSKIAEISSSPVKTFTIGFKNKKYDERNYAEIVSKVFNTEHKLEVANPEDISILPDILNSFGEPFSDSSAIPTFIVSKIAKKYVTVIITGDGGDEVFAGYNHYERMHKYLYLNGIPINIRKFVQYIGKYLPKQMPGYGLLQRQAYSNIELYHEMQCHFSKEQKLLLYSDDFKKNLIKDEKELFQKIIDENNLSDMELITKLQLIDFKSYLPDDVLTKVDRMSMRHSLETRVPLLDHELIELVFACPENIRYKNRNLKYIIKRILSKKLPKTLIHRKKQGFGVPLSSWFRNELKYFTMSLLENIKSDQIINYNYVYNIYNLHQKGGRDFSKYLYNILVYKYWQMNK